MRYRILISDDEVDIVEMLTGFFRSKGYEVFSAYNGVETLKLAELQPDIILLDINMPKLDGIEVCKKIRDYVSCPILFLTARIEENDKVQGFSVGGDDYIVKPFSLVELEARVQAHLRREERHQTNTKVKFSGELLIDYSERNVYIQNQPIGLVKKEFDIVELLSQNAGQVFDKERIHFFSVKPQRKNDIFPHIDGGYQIECLKYKSDLSSPENGKLILLHGIQVLVRQDHAAAGWCIQPAQHMQQGTFSGAGFSDNGDKFSLPNLDIHMIDGFDLIFPRPIKFAKLIRF